MKKTAMHIYDFAMANKNKIRCPRKATLVKTIPKSKSMYYRPDNEFGLRVAISNSRHIETALLRGVYIGHDDTQL